jgi:hypothetical protein
MSTRPRRAPRPARRSIRRKLKKYLAAFPAGAAIAIILTFLSLTIAAWGFYLNAPNSDYSVKVSDLEGTVAPGGSNSTIIIVSAKDLSIDVPIANKLTLKQYDGGEVKLDASLNNNTMQPFISLKLTNNDGTPLYNSQLNVFVDPATPPGDYPVAITALSAFGVMHTCQYLLHVTNATFALEFIKIDQPNSSVNDSSFLEFSSNHFRKDGQEVNVSLSREFYVDYSIAKSVPSGQHIIVAINPHNTQTWYATLRSRQELDGSWSAGPFNASNMSQLPNKDQELKYTIAAVAVNDTVYQQISASNETISSNLVPIHLESSYQLLDFVTFKGNG